MHPTGSFEIVESCLTCPVRHQRMFCDLPDDALKALEAIKVTTAYPKGALLCMEGQPARGIFLLCTGRAKISVGAEDGKTVILHIAEPGEALGVTAVVEGKNYDATVETLEPTQTSFISRQDFVAFLTKYSSVGMKLVSQLSRNCKQAYDEIRCMGLSASVPQKLARLILHWSEHPLASRKGPAQIRVTLTQEEIAQSIGTTRETVSRTLGGFRRDGWLTIKGSLWTLANKPALERLVGN